MHIEHSEILEYLKSKDPKALPYSSYQLFTLLDSLLYAALDPIIDHSDLADRVISSLVTWQVNNKRRKISKYSRDSTISILLAIIKTKDTEVKKQIYKSLCLERSISFLMIKHFLDECAEFVRLSDEYLLMPYKDRPAALYTLHQISTKVGWTLGHPQLYGYCKEIRFWFDLYCAFKEKIVEKYYRHIFNQVTSEAKRSVVQVDVEDMAQNYVVAASKAVDKFQTEKGTFTSYLDFWIKDAKTNTSSGHYYGLAFTVPDMDYVTGSQQTNISDSLDSEELAATLHADDSPELTLERESIQERIRSLALYADPYGFAVEALGLLPEEVDDS